MSDVTLRPATVDDAPAISAVLEAAWDAAYTDILPVDARAQAHDSWHTPEPIREPISAVDHATTVALQTDRLVGYADATRPDPADDPRLGVVGVLYVHPDCWGEGIGSRLWEHSLQALRDLGASRVSVRVFAENEVGREFYESKGLIQERTIEETLFGEPVRSVEYEAPLDEAR